MHTETFDFASAGQFSGPVREGLLRRVIRGVRDLSVQYELDAHLAQDIGAQSYTVPLFGAVPQGGSR
jgi:hypothetical protein